MYDRPLSHTFQEPANIAAFNPNQGTNEPRRRHPRSGNSVTAVPAAPEPTANMPFGISPAHQRLALRGLLVIFGILIVRSLFGGRSESREIQSHGVIERALFTDKYLDVTKYPFLQSRQGRDDRPDLFDEEIQEGVIDFWTRFQKPFITGKDSARMDTQIMRSVVDDLLKWRGWVAAACSTLHRPFQQSGDDKYEDLASADQMYYVAITIHSADHFLVDQLAVIVQLARRLGTRNIFVSMLDMDSTDSTPTLMDLCEAILTILGIAFRIRRVPAMTTDPSASYYPLEEAYVRNLALEPLHELWKRRSLKFHRVIWLKGFTCPNDVLESLRVSEMNSAAMVCGMDWAEHNGFFIFSDRWRTRDIEGNLFRQAKSNSKPEAGPPRDSIGTERYKGHLPFQVFCCESGSHVVDPEQSYYRNIAYRASPLAHNLSTAEEPPSWDPETQCMDSTQMWFCRDLWTDAAHGGLKEGKRGGQHVKLAGAHKKRAQVEEPEYTVQADNNELLSRVIEERGVDPGENAAKLEIIETESGPEVQKVPKAKRQQLGAKPNDNQQKEGDAQAATGDETGTDIDAIDEENAGPAPEPLKPLPASAYLVPNSAFTPARILVNPRCVTTYGGVSHTQLALDLFGNRDEPTHNGGNYVLDDWAGPPDSFVCQEMRTTGGRTAPKSQRRVGFLLQNEVGL